MGKIKAVFFDIDNTLYDTSKQVNSARENVIKAMIEAGLPVNEKAALVRLDRIVKKYGSNYKFHYDRLLESFGIEPNPRIICAGILAYGNTKLAYLTPYPETIPTLIRLRDMDLKLGIISEGLPVKQWEKLIRLGLQHFFDVVIISKEKTAGKPRELFKKACGKLNLKPSECIMVGDRLDKDIAGANKAGLITVQILTERYSRLKPKNKFEKPAYTIKSLGDLIKLVKKIGNK